MRGDRDRIRLAADALSQVRADAWARGDRPDFPERPGAQPNGLPDAGARPRRDDPQPLAAALGGLLSSRGWKQQAAVGAVFGGWEQIVGPELAAHTKPDSFNDGDLVVLADSTVWATQVRLLAPQVVKRLAEELGSGVVRRVRVHGPDGYSPRARRPRGQQRHVRLSLPGQLLTLAKIDSGHAESAAGSWWGTLRGSRACWAVQDAQAFTRRLRQDGVAFVLRCSVDHGT